MSHSTSIRGYSLNTRAAVYSNRPHQRTSNFKYPFKKQHFLFLVLIFQVLSWIFQQLDGCQGAAYLISIILINVPMAWEIIQSVPDNHAGDFGPESAPHGKFCSQPGNPVWFCSCHHFLRKPKEREGKLKSKDICPNSEANSF